VVAKESRLGLHETIHTRHIPFAHGLSRRALLRLTKYGLDPVTVEKTDHYRLMREFCADPATFIETMMDET
jgi:hypothetical protein